jgi:putative DNA primase/helicase
MTANELAARVKAKRVGKYFKCRCPAHEDSDPSLSFWQGHTSVRVKCFTGCEASDVIAAWRAQGVWPDPPKRRSAES